MDVTPALSSWTSWIDVTKVLSPFTFTGDDTKGAGTCACVVTANYQKGKSQNGKMANVPGKVDISWHFLPAGKSTVAKSSRSKRKTKSLLRQIYQARSMLNGPPPLYVFRDSCRQGQLSALSLFAFHEYLENSSWYRGFR